MRVEDWVFDDGVRAGVKRTDAVARRKVQQVDFQSPDCGAII